MPRSFLSTGSTTLNLACADTPWGGLVPGHYYWFVGDSNSGKTWLAYTCLAEAARSQAFDDYRFIVDQPEAGALFDVARYFGQQTADRIETPYDDGPSQLTEDFYYWLDDAFKVGRPFIGILDSMDVLDTNDDLKKFDATKAARRGAGKQVAGTYGMAKARMNSANLRRVVSGLQATGSILIIISQTRDDINPSTFATKTVAGGRALKFYATMQIWTSVAQQIRRTVAGKDRQLGVVAKVQIKKNRLTGKDRSCEVPIYHSYGIDDVGGCVAYLVGEGHWPKTKEGVITARELKLQGQHEKIVRAIIDSGRVAVLQDLAGDVWRDIEAKCVIDRPQRYQ